MDIIQHSSPNFDARPDGSSVRYLILHYTGMKTADEALTRLCDPAAKVSTHYFIEEDGKIFQLVQDQKRAWHAGVSEWRNETNLNNTSIGIELVNPGHEFGYRPFAPQQIESVQNLCTSLIDAYGVLPENILGHADIAPDRKEDPGELFPWAQLAANGIGIWPQPEKEDFEAVKSWTLDEYVAGVRAYGYTADVGYEYILRAFERHFAPELILGTSQDETMARARLSCLLRLYCDKNSTRTVG